MSPRSHTRKKIPTKREDQSSSHGTLTFHFRPQFLYYQSRKPLEESSSFSHKKDGTISLIVNKLFNSDESSKKKRSETKLNLKKNILSKPVAVKFKIVNNRLVVLDELKVSGKKLISPSFEIETSKRWIKSISFSSGKNLFNCKGIMQKGGKRFFVYFCEDRDQ